MAVNPIQFLVAQNASITDGTKTITISGNVDCSRVYSGTAIFLGGADNPAEAVSGTSPDGSGNSTITLRNSWSQGDIVNQQLVSFNTNEGLAEAISNVREIVSNVSAIEDLATQGLIKRIDDNNYEVVNISVLGESLVGANDASTARSVLALGSAATKNTGIEAGDVVGVSSGGRVGVGENNPLTKLHVKSAGSDSTVRIESTSNSGGQSRYVNTLSDFSVGITGGTNGDFLIYDNNNSRTMAEYSNAAGWDFRTIGIERLSITNAGKVGINKTNPQYIFHARESEALLGNAGLMRLEKFNSGDFHVLDVELDNSINTVRYRSTGTNNGGHVFSNATQDLVEIKSDGKLEVGGNEVYHKGNTRFYDFGGLSGDVVARGASALPTLAVFYLDIPALSTPTSISVTGTFKIRSPLSNTDLVTGVTPQLNTANASRSLAVITVTTSGLPSTPQPLELVAENTASIVVNL